MKTKKKKWSRTGNIYNPVYGSEVLDFPEKGVFEVKISPDSGVYLQKITDQFNFPFDVYETEETKTQVKVVKKTFESAIMVDNLRSLGVILNGCKGSGKTVTAKQICNSMQMPVIIVTSLSSIVESFINELDFDCVILIDEFEKIVPEGSKESLALLRLLDGVGKNINDSRKLFLMTSNSLKNIDPSFKSRMARVRYIFEYSKKLPDEVVDSYLEKHLPDKEIRFVVKDFLGSLDILTFDVLSQIVEEAVIHGSLEDTKSSLNVEVKKSIATFYYLSIPVNESNRIKETLDPLGGLEGLGKIMSTSSKIFNTIGCLESEGEVIEALEEYKKTVPDSKIKELSDQEIRDLSSLFENHVFWARTSISRFYNGSFYIEDDNYQYRLNNYEDSFLKGIDPDGNVKYLYFQGKVLNILGLKP